MSLVPIIYTSLLIFSSFLLFVLIVSYISYRAKGKGSLPRSAEMKPIRRLVLASNPIPVNNYIRESIVKQVHSELPITISNNFSTKRHFTQNVENRRSERPKINQRENNTKLSGPTLSSKINKSSVTDAKNKTTQSIERQRIEIINHNENFKTFEENRNSKVTLPKHGPNLAEMNILNYYSDNNEFDMVTLSATQLHRAI